MDKKKVVDVLERIKRQEIDVDQAADLLSTIHYEDIGFAKVDHNRKQRTGYPEVIYCDGKTEHQIARIIEKMCEQGDNVLGTRITKEKYEYLKERFSTIRYDSQARIIQLENHPIETTGKGTIVVATGGTSDIPVAEEAAITASFFGNSVERVYDIGVAGLHRLLDHLEVLRQARVIITVAGMEGALPSVIAGLVKAPVIAVPTSIGYGANFGGLSALLSMINSCAPGLSLVNIDNGFGAGYLASTINHL